ncbi:MAG TPA: hypothetical protein VIF11_18650 [Methylomirabilota bacterium]
MAVSKPVRASINASATTGMRRARRPHVAKMAARAHPATRMARPCDDSPRRIQLVSHADNVAPDVSI